MTGGPFDLNRVVAETFVREVVYYETIHSTNDVALDRCRDSQLATPLLVVAGSQSAGRGRSSNRWWSSPGALMFSLIVDPQELGLADRDFPRASLATGLAVCLVIQQLAPKHTSLLKWPNDVLLEDRKVSGILIEIGQATSALVIGIGINVNNSFRAAPQEQRTVATSLIDVTQTEFELIEVLLAVLGAVEAQLVRLARDDPGLPADWQRNCGLRGRRIEVTTGNHTAQGVCAGIGSDGALLLSTEHGTRRLFAGSVEVATGAGAVSPGEP